MFPGFNPLKMAQRIIAFQTVTYFQAVSRALNSVGQWITTYDAGVSMQGSFQPLPTGLYEQYGLDLAKSYYTFYTSNNVQVPQRDVSGDQISFNSNRYQCESNANWYATNGFKSVLCVLIGSASSSLPSNRP